MKDERLFSLPACSGMTLRSRSGRPYWFRTCDTENDIWEEGAHLLFVPRGEGLELAGGRGIEVEYGFGGLTYNEKDTWLLDGINEAGLTGGLLMLQEGTSVPAATAGRGCVGMELVTYLLATCQTVKEIKLAAENIQILDIPFGEERVPATMHYFFVDVSGDEVILEAADSDAPGRLKAYGWEEGIGVMTNSPVYPRQLSNLSTFLEESPQIRQAVTEGFCPTLEWDGRKLGQRNRKLGKKEITGERYPGSYCSTDRFLRLALFKALNSSGAGFSDENMLALGSEIMGSVVEPFHGGILHYDGLDASGRVLGQKSSMTRYLVVYDLWNRRLCFRKRGEVDWKYFGLYDRGWKKP